MRLHSPDWKWACLAAGILLGIAAFVVFAIRPGGFEGQGAWFVLLLPGSIPADLLSDFVYKLAPSAGHIAYWTLSIGCSFTWYGTVSYAAIRTFHKSGWKLGSPDL
jgi:hypothetical protein